MDYPEVVDLMTSEENSFCFKVSLTLFHKTMISESQKFRNYDTMNHKNGY